MARSVKFAAPKLLQTRVQLWRSRFIFSLLGLAFVALVGKALTIQTTSKSFLQAQGAQRYEKTVELQANRGRIVDRHGVVLASSSPVRSIWANPDRVDMADPRLNDLARLLEQSPAELQKRLTDDRSFVFLKRQVDLDTADRIRALRMRGIGQDGEYKREYPEGESVAHLVGFTSLAHAGQEGLELAYEKVLAGHAGARRVMRNGTGQIIGELDQVREPRDGRDLALTIDTRIQAHAFQVVKSAVAQHKARAGAAIVLDARTGEILALANWPTYTPGDPSSINRKSELDSNLRNRAITDLYEPGSTLKPFTAALALESGKYRPSSMFDAREGRMTIGRDTIRDSHRIREPMTLEQVIQRSSNIGTAKIALSLPAEDHWKLLTSLGFGQAPRIGFPGAAAGRLRPAKRWKPIEHATISYGHGLSVSLLQVARAYTAFASNGELLPLSLLQSDDTRSRPMQVSSRGRPIEDTVQGVPVMKPETAAAVRRMLEMAAGPKGTAPSSQVPGYRVGGKSGTTMKLENGRYVKKYVSSFVGLAPMSNPRVIVAVMIDDPTSGKYYGGSIGGPMFSSIAGESLRLMAVEPDLPVDSLIAHPVDPAARPAGRPAAAATRASARPDPRTRQPAANAAGSIRGGV